MDRETGPYGLKKQFSYQEVLRAIQQQPHSIKVPPRAGLRQWDDPFYQNLIQGQGAYLGDVAKSGFSHEAPYTPPPRDEAFYDARSDFGDVSVGSGGGRPPPPPPGNLGVFSQLFEGDDPGRPFDLPDENAGHWGFLPPPPPGNPGVFSALYGQRAGNQPIQSGFVAPFPVAPPVQISLYPQLTRNYLEQEGVELPPPPVQPSFFQQVSQSIRDGARSAAMERAGQFGAAVGAGAANVGGQVLRGVGGAIRDGAVRAFDWDRGYLWRAADEAGNVILNPNSWRQNTNIEFLRRGVPALQDAEEAGALLANEAAAGEALGMGLGMAEGAELGLLGGPAGAIAGASLGAVAGAALAFRARDAPEREDHFLDARSVNGGNESARPLRSRFDLALDQRQRNPRPLRPRLEWPDPERQTPRYYRMDTPSPPPWRADDEAPGRQQDVMRPTAAARPQEQRLSAQEIVDGIAAAQPRGPEALRPARRTPGDRNRMPPSQPAGSSQDIMRPTTAPMAHGLNAAPSLPSLPSQPSRRRNRGAS